MAKVFGTRNQRVIRSMQKQIKFINVLETDLKDLSDQELAGKTDEFKSKIAQGASLASLLPQAFAVVREASRRVLGLRHFDVQLIGGLVLFEGKISEMRTGEGKTLAATLPAYLMALSGKGVHIVTVNEYLVKRDAEWMAPIYEFLGLTVKINVPGMSPEEKREAYQADVVYGTNNEFGFDYLRDNMAMSSSEKCQRPLHFAIIDEVDSILIDEARTPLIISGPSEQSTEMYRLVDSIAQQLEKQKEEEGPGHFSIDEKSKQAYLTESGHEKVEQVLSSMGLIDKASNLYDAKHVSLMHHVQSALRAHYLYQRDVDYIIKDDQVVIVDEHTGRLMPGRRWSDGLHQAIEAKESVQVESENQTLATITFQNYFRMYEKLSGMTGTADTEAYEFQQIYGLEVVVMPTNKPMVRADSSDYIFLTEKEKDNAIVQEIKRVYASKQPILVGTASIEASEHLSGLLNKEKIPHEVLNAKNHLREAKIIAQAGKPGAVTIATNMAGRGTDIVLGGNLDIDLAEKDSVSDDELLALKGDWKKSQQQVLEAGGLYVLGSERNESRRIDNQLRGRSGRQGDPGFSRFYLSLEDNLMRIFAADRLKGMMQRLGMETGEVLHSRSVTRVIEGAQRKVEGYNFDMRKQLLQYDDVTNEQRHLIYQQRDALLEASQVNAMVESMEAQVVDILMSRFVPPQSFEEQWDINGLQHALTGDFGLHLPVNEWLEKDKSMDVSKLSDLLLESIRSAYAEKREQMTFDVMDNIEKIMLLQLLDVHWKEHLVNLEMLRQGIHLRGYAQKNPAQEYKREAFELFQEMLNSLRYMAIGALLQMQSVPKETDEMGAESGEDESSLSSISDKVLSRNAPCPCGSGKKYKRCHGKLA